MTDTGNLVRSTTRALAGTVQAVRPLPPLPQAPRPDEYARGRGRLRRWAGWLAPLAAAAAITMVVAVLVVVRGAASGTGHTHAPAAAAAVPEYYVMLRQTSLTSVASLAVGDTRTGKQVADVPAPAGGTFTGVTGAADDRTFVVDAVHGATGFGANARPRTWYLLRIFPGSARPVRLTPLPIPATAEQTVVHWIALSPDGTRLAVMLQPYQNKVWGPAGLRIYSVATGRVLRSWTVPAPRVVIPSVSSGIDSNTSLTWLADGHTLAMKSTQVSDNGTSTATIRTLDVNRPGTNLLASSRIVWYGLTSAGYSVGGPAAKCLPNGLVFLSGDGKTVICGTIIPALTLRNLPSQPCVPGVLPGTVELAEYSVATGRLLRALAAYPASCASGDLNVYPLWASATGNAVIGYLDTRARTASGHEIPGVTRFGVFSAGAFRSLPYPPLSGGVSLPEHIAW